MNPISANDYGTVMQRRSFVKQISQKAHRNPGIHNGPGFNNIIQHGFPFKNNQRPGTGCRKIIHRCHNFLYHFNGIFLVQASELTGNDVPTSQLLQSSTQFRLEQDNQGEESHGHEITKQPIQQVQFQKIGQKENDTQNHQSTNQLLCTGLLDKSQNLIDQICHNNDIQHIN